MIINSLFYWPSYRHCSTMSPWILLAAIFYIIIALPVHAGGKGGDSSYNADDNQFGINSGAGGGGGGNGAGGQGSPNVLVGSNGGTSNGGNGSNGRTVSSGTPGIGGTGGAAGNATNPVGGAGGIGGKPTCDGNCQIGNGNGGGGGGGGGVGFSGVFSNITNTIIGGKGGNGGSPEEGTSGSGADGGSGGGGGGGVYLSNGTASANVNITGGAGGDGGKPFLHAGAGIGGDGGSAIQATNATININNVNITGGNGGTGGSGNDSDQTRGRMGGAGGDGITGSQLTIINNGVIRGGNGGFTGQYGEGIAEGGAGIKGSDLAIINAKSIIGGRKATESSPSGNSVYFTGGSNKLELQSGWSFTGNVDAASSGNQFILGGDQTDLNDSYNGSQLSTIFNAAQFANKFQKFSSFAKTGASTWRLIGVISQSTPWTLSGGILQIGGINSLGSTAILLTLDGGTLQFINDITIPTGRTVNITSAGGTLDTQTNNSTIAGNITGAAGASMTKTGSGTLTLTGANTYGDTLISGGKLLIGNGGTTGSINGNVMFPANASVEFNRSDTLIFDKNITGNGALIKNGAGTLVLTGSNGYSGGTTISNGILQLGNGNNSGSFIGSVLNNGALAFNRNDNVNFSGIISGIGAVNQLGSGATTLTVNNSYTGATNITNGALYVNGDQTSSTGATTVSSGATLGGTGVLGGAVTVADGGTLAPGGAVVNSIGKLTVLGDLVLNGGSIMDYSFGEANTENGSLNDLTVVGGNLTLDGTLNVSETSGGLFDPGIYRVIRYGGTLVDNQLALGGLPPGSTLFVQTSVASEVNLINNTGLTLNFWDGGAPANKNDGAVNGGDGVWQHAALGNDNWTSADGGINAPWTDADFAIFQADPGTVTVDNSQGQVSASGMQFASDGYTVDGEAITLVETNAGTGKTLIEVGDHTIDGAGYSTTISAVLQGSTQLVKTDLGTLILAGDNTYTGGTAINGGTVQIANDSNLGAPEGTLSFNGGTLAIAENMVSSRLTHLAAGGGTLEVFPATSLTMNGIIAGGGSLTKIGTGTLTLTGDNAYSGGTTISSGTLQLGTGGDTGAIIGDVINNAMMVFSRNNTLTYGGVISGAGAVNQMGSGTTVLTGDSEYRGGTTISNGTLQLGNGGTTGSIVGNVNNSGILAFNRSDTLSFDGIISGNGVVNQIGDGTTTFTAANDYFGGTTISAGTLQLGSGGTTGSIVGNVTNEGTLAFNRSDTMTFAGTISGNGGVSQIGSGTTILTAANDYAGTTQVQTGILRAGAINVFSPASVIMVAKTATLALDGRNQVVAGLNNGGVVNLTGGGGPGTALTVKGDYVGNNGTLVLNTQLGDDNSATDRVIIDGGQASGSTGLVIKTAGSRGAVTTRGINIIQAINGATTGASTFHLDPTSDGYNQVGNLNVGAYNYNLQRGGNSGQANDWYLVSQLSPAMGSYLEDRQSVMAMQIHSLHDRQWQVPGQEDTYTWLRMEGTAVQHDGINGQKSDDTRWVLHGGSDVARFSDGHDGSIRVGLMAQYSTSSGSTKDDVSSSDQSVKGYSGGIYATWFGHHDTQTGPYVDTWLMYGTFDNDVTGQGQRTESYRSRDTTTSVEGGYKFKIAESPTARHYLVPQAQVIYSDYRAKDHTTSSGSVASDMSADSVTTRLGVRLTEDRLDENGLTRMQPFVEVNWWHGPSSQTMRMDQTVVRESIPADRGEFKLGVKGNVSKDLSVTGAVGVDTDMSSYKAGRATVGISYLW